MPLDPESLRIWNDIEEDADSMGLPKEWRTCAHCGMQSWRFPPHMFRECPYVKEMAEAAGLKMDAERMTAVRTGTQIEEMTRAFRAHFYREDDDGE